MKRQKLSLMLRRSACLVSPVAIVLAAGVAVAAEDRTFVLHLDAEQSGNSSSSFAFLPQQLAQADQNDDLAPLSGGEGVPFYKIGVGDRLNVIVWRFPDLSTSVTVRPDGFVSLPLVEDLRIAGLTPTEASEAVQERLTEFIQEPLVTIVVDNPVGTFDQQIRVIGKATQPRALPWRRGIRLADVIISVGGLTPDADGNSAVLLRQEEGETRELPLRLDDLIDRGDVSANLMMQPGDVIVIPEGFFSGDWTVTYGAASDITFTDNLDLDPDGEKDAGVIFRVGPNISIIADAARIQGELSAQVFLVEEFSESVETRIDADLVGTTTAELVEQRVFVDASAGISQIRTDNERAESGSDANTSGQEFVQAYRVSPYLVSRLGSFATNELRYQGSAVFIDSDDASNTITHQLSSEFVSGTDFTFLGWALSSSISEEFSDDGDDISRRDANFTLFYPLPFYRRFVLEGSVGYRILENDGDDDDDIEGITWRTGFSWLPNPRFESTAGVGSDAETIVFDADIRYQATPRLALTASYVEETTTQQDRIVANLPTTDEGIDDFNESPNAFSLDDGVTRTRTISFGAAWQKRNVTASLRLAYEEESEDVSDFDSSDEESYIINTNVSVGLARDWTFVGSFSGDWTERSETDDDDTEVEVFPSARLEYQLAPNFSTNLTYSYSRRFADDEEDEYTENAVTLGGRITF